MNSTIRPSTPSRSAFTLLELVVVIAVVALIASMSARLFHALMRQQTTATVQLAMSSSISRMRDHFTRDVNFAVDANVSADAIELTQPEDVTVRWERSGNYMVRTRKEDGEVRNDHFDVLPEQRTSYTQTIIAGETNLIVVELTTDTKNRRDDRYVTSSRARIIAELGRDHRWGSSLSEVRE